MGFGFANYEGDFELETVRLLYSYNRLVIALQGGTIIYFELDQLGKLQEVSKTQLDQEVLALDIGEIP